ncbi:MAG: T9SS type A sorting domain-containing protein [bacterium]|nr:MAG: T9SS type A sorting domain-containing protein [bacterium]
MRNKRDFFLFILLGCFLSFSPGKSQEIRYGNLYYLIFQIRNAMPGENSYTFLVPTTTQMDSFRTMTQHVINQNYTVADSFAQKLGYVLYEWYDTAMDSTRYYLLMEPNANVSGGVELGWGTFIFYPEGEEQVIIEVPHPYFDTNTWRVGFVAFQRLSNRYFLMAGTHRYANGTNPRPADVAHNTQNMFHVIHEEVSPLSHHALQVHGFNINNHPGYPDVILSNGTPNPGQILDSLAQEFMTEGYTVGIFDGINYASLGATTNTQGQFSNAHGYSFIHMELEYFIRASTSQWEKVVDALSRIFTIPLAILPWESLDRVKNFILSPGYPNPFNNSVRFTIRIVKPVKIAAVVYNTLGQKIRTLNKSWISAGLYSVSWDGVDEYQQPVSSGIYYMVCSDNQNIQIQKITVLK